jgi:hypothetical protein
MLTANPTSDAIALTSCRLSGPRRRLGVLPQIAVLKSVNSPFSAAVSRAMIQRIADQTLLRYEFTGTEPLSADAARPCRAKIGCLWSARGRPAAALPSPHRPEA